MLHELNQLQAILEKVEAWRQHRFSDTQGLKRNEREETCESRFLGSKSRPHGVAIIGTSHSVSNGNSSLVMKHQDGFVSLRHCVALVENAGSTMGCARVGERVHGMMAELC